MSISRRKRTWFFILAIVLIAALGTTVWIAVDNDLVGRLPPPIRELLQRNHLAAHLILANGRLEATEVDVAAKLSGRLVNVFAREGDTVEAGTVLARLDTASLEAHLRQAEAELRRAERDRDYALAIVAQRKSELGYADREAKRLLELKERNYAAEEKVDQARTAARTAEAARRAAQVKVAETEAAIEAAAAQIERIAADISDSALKAPRRGRVLYRMAEPGEVLGSGGKVLTLLDLTDLYMSFFLPGREAGRVAIGAEARLVLDAAPEYVIPAQISFIAARAQFTPKQVETRSEREKLVFRAKARIDPALLERYEPLVKTGLPGSVYVRLDPQQSWPEWLAPKLPPWPGQTNHSPN